jgi:uncharacterized protein YaiI (UPF0178 family)
LLDIYLDADACPVKEEAFRVAQRYGLGVLVVGNSWLRLPDLPRIERVVVGEGLDRADDWIAERAGPGDIVVTADVPLAARCVRAGARALAPDGRLFSEASIGTQLAVRDLMTGLREAGQVTGGPRPFTRQDRSRFLQALDGLVVAVRRQGR